MDVLTSPVRDRAPGFKAGFGNPGSASRAALQCLWNFDVEVVIGDPGRANRAKFTMKMIDLGYLHRFEKFDQQLQDGNRCKGRISHYHRNPLS